MNETLRVLMERKSVRVFEKRPIGPEEKQAILNAPCGPPPRETPCCTPSWM